MHSCFATISLPFPGNYQITLFDDTQETVTLYQAIDSIKHQYGEQFLIRAAGFDGKRDDKPKVEKWLRQFKSVKSW